MSIATDSAKLRVFLSEFDLGIPLDKWIGLDDYTHRKRGTTFSGSTIGHECLAYIGHTVRGSARSVPDTRTLRMFRMGHDAEAQVMEGLQSWCTLRDHTLIPVPPSEEQHMGYAGAFLAYADGLLQLKDTTQAMVVEVKSCSDAVFQKVKRLGTEYGAPKYADQATTLMKLLDCKWTLFIYINRDNGDLVLDGVEYDETRWYYLVDKAESVSSLDPVPRITDNPSYYQCKMCHYSHQCFKDQYDVEPVRCSQCVYATLPEPAKDDIWHCNKHDRPARKLCGDFEYWKPIPRSEAA